MNSRRKLRELLKSDEAIVIPGAFDALSARIIEDVGFPAVYMTGAGFANAAFGVPDIGLVSASDVFAQARRMVMAVDIPVVADADTGYGGVLHVRNTVAELERAGVAAIQLEDQVIAKRCGHFDGQQLVSRVEMAQKVRMAVETRQDHDLVLIARTDARNAEGFAAAVERAKAYVEAGADAIFVEALRSREEILELPKAVEAPLVINMVEGGKTPLVSVAELTRAGYHLVLYANTALRASIAAVKDAMEVLDRDGGTEALLGRVASWDERQRLVGLSAFQSLEEAYSEVSES